MPQSTLSWPKYRVINGQVLSSEPSAALPAALQRSLGGLVLAGGEGERGFAKRFPTITVDGCGKLCAAIGTTRFSNKPSVEINLEDYPDFSSLKTEEKWHIQESSLNLVEKLATDIANHVDKIRNTSE